MGDENMLSSGLLTSKGMQQGSVTFKFELNEWMRYGAIDDCQDTRMLIFITKTNFC